LDGDGQFKEEGENTMSEIIPSEFSFKVSKIETHASKMR
jgi:hypothetical protein